MHITLKILGIIISIVFYIWLYKKLDKLEKTKKETKTVSEISEIDAILPEKFEALIPILDKHKIEHVSVSLIKSPDEDLTVYNSKILGKPYWPKNKPFPKDEHGNDLIMFAQINFSEVPHIESYPESGILQWFITTGHSDPYGYSESDIGMANWFAKERSKGNPLNGKTLRDFMTKKNYRIVYHEDVTTDKSEILDIEANVDEQSSIPASYCCKMQFKKADDYPSHSDYRYLYKISNEIEDALELHFGDEDQQGLRDEFEDLMSDSYEGTGHKIGGYAYFTQDDPRPTQEDWLLLMQIDSDDEAGICWGDVGVGHLFIRKEDLQAKDFDAVIYSWDCS
jgi:uncharacterized protein YwqG